jgi:excisionase family DNA binding protein
MNTKTADRTPTLKPGYLRRAEAARYLGVSLRTVANFQANRVIPFSKLGAKTVLFKIADLDASIARYRVDSIMEG